MTQENKTSSTEEQDVTPTPVEGTEPKVEEKTTPAVEPATDGKAEEQTPANDADSEDDSDDLDEDSENDPDVLDDDEPIQNKGHLKKLRSRNASLARRLKVETEEKERISKEYEEYKANGQSSEADTKKIAELEAALQAYQEKDVEEAKKAALKEAGLPENLIKTLKGTDEEWREVLDIHKENYKNLTPRLTDDSVTNGLNGKYKPTSSEEDILQAARNMRHNRIR
jgi:arsenate reductase-like glutaredoxin family protein